MIDIPYRKIMRVHPKLRMELVYGWYVYGLVDPRDKLIHYIGVTYDPLQRYLSHLYDGKVLNTLKGLWLRELNELGLRPGFVVLELVEGWDAQPYEAERKWIDVGSADGLPLTNGNRRLVSYNQRSLHSR